MFFIRFLYLGCDTYVNCLEKLIAQKHEVCKIFIPKSSDPFLSSFKIQEIAKTFGIPLSDEKITRAELEHYIESRACDFVITAEYPYKISIPKTPLFRGVNFHYSLLPEGRGYWPLPFYILQERPFAGITFHKLDRTIDTGDILLQQKFPIEAQDNIHSLLRKCHMAAESLFDVFLSDPIQCYNKAVPQQGGSYWPKPRIADSTITREMSIRQVRLVYRAFWNEETCVDLNGCLYHISDLEAFVFEDAGLLQKECLKDGFCLLQVKDGIVVFRLGEPMLCNVERG